jgi:glycosyltransferase involved in cell wall biosynthesis
MTEIVSGKTRLCIVTPAHSKSYPGGAEYQIDCLIEALRRHERYEIFYLAARISDMDEPRAYQIVKIGDRTHAPRFGYLTQAVPLYRALRRLQPQIIYQRVACGYTGIAAFYARRHAATLVWHVAHDSDLNPQASLDGRNPVRRFLEKRSVEYGIRHARHIVTQTRQQARLLEQNYQRSASAVIPNFHPVPREIIDKSGAIRVLWVANLKPWKQPEVFVRLAVAMRDLANVRFIMIGSAQTGRGDRAWGESLMRQIEAVPNLDYLGPRSQDEVNGLLANAHLFVNTSVAEGFPNTFIQSWMRKVPVVSLNVNPDGVFDREAVGICAGSEEGLVGAARLLITDNRLRAQFAHRAHDYAIVNHSPRNADALIQLFDADKVN